MLGAPSIIAGAPSILSEWAKMPFTQVDPYDLRTTFTHTHHKYEKSAGIILVF